MSQDALEMYNLYVAAEKEVLLGKSTTINGRVFTSEDLGEIRAGRREWEQKLSGQQASNAGKKRSTFAQANF